MPRKAKKQKELRSDDLMDLTILELRDLRDSALLRKNRTLALQCAIAIDKKKGYYGAIITQL